MRVSTQPRCIWRRISAAYKRFDDGPTARDESCVFVDENGIRERGARRKRDGEKAGGPRLLPGLGMKRPWLGRHIETSRTSPAFTAIWDEWHASKIRSGGASCDSSNTRCDSQGFVAQMLASMALELPARRGFRTALGASRLY